jgi:hypothetical protein
MIAKIFNTFSFTANLQSEQERMQVEEEVKDHHPEPGKMKLIRKSVKRLVVAVGIYP